MDTETYNKYSKKHFQIETKKTITFFLFFFPQQKYLACLILLLFLSQESTRSLSQSFLTQWIRECLQVHESPRLFSCSSIFGENSQTVRPIQPVCKYTNDSQKMYSSDPYSISFPDCCYTRAPDKPFFCSRVITRDITVFWLSDLQYLQRGRWGCTLCLVSFCGSLSLKVMNH